MGRNRYVIYAEKTFEQRYDFDASDIPGKDIIIYSDKCWILKGLSDKHCKVYGEVDHSFCCMKSR